MSENQEKKQQKWILAGILVSLIMAILFTCFYGMLKNTAHENMKEPLESEYQLSYLFNNTYVLYRDLHNKKNQTNASYEEIYLKAKEGYEWLLDEDVWNLSETEFFTKFYGKDYADESQAEELTSEDWEFFEGYRETVEYVKNRFVALENEFTSLNNAYDYLIEDADTETYLSNLTEKDIKFEEQMLYLSFVFDENGNVSLDSNIRGNDITRLRKNANKVMRELSLTNMMGSRKIITEGYLALEMPKNCRITYCISEQDWTRMMSGDLYSASGSYLWVDQYNAYSNTPVYYGYILLLLLVLLTAMFCPGLQKEHPWNEVKLCKGMPIEGLLVLAYVILGLAGAVVPLVIWVNEGSGISRFSVYMSSDIADLLVYGVNIIVLTALFMMSWYVGICLRALRELGVKNYFKDRSFCYRIFPYLKRKYREFYEEAAHFDVTKDAKKLIRKTVIINGIILFIICCLPFVGLVIALVYSVILYLILKKYISNLQQKYSILLGATNKIAEGNLNVSMKEDLGVFEPFKPQIIRIQSGFKKAVEEETKSQRMKSELITNVSHDLKTPLTAIITYINLLKEDDITEKQRKEYLDTLERKSMRLKVLIEDLFEVSKANSQNLTINLVDVDIANLLKQVSFEMEDKLKERQLDIRLDLPKDKVVLSLDSQKTYRIFENLLGNVAKYALIGTRVYIKCINTDKEISIVIKNISSQEILVSSEELTERFVRGDVSRNTEGSGLGLAIAKSFTELQGGKFNIDLDGDLFKVTVSFYKESQMEKKKE